LACAWVKPPVICTRPSVMGDTTEGLKPEAMMVRPSRTMANCAFCESVLWTPFWLEPAAAALSR
jgi:hypothetical protein